MPRTLKGSNDGKTCPDTLPTNANASMSRHAGTRSTAAPPRTSTDTRQVTTVSTTTQCVLPYVNHCENTSLRRTTSKRVAAPATHHKTSERPEYLLRITSKRVTAQNNNAWRQQAQSTNRNQTNTRDTGKRPNREHAAATATRAGNQQRATARDTGAGSAEARRSTACCLLLSERVRPESSTPTRAG